MHKRRLLATDLDGTFIGDRAAMLSLWGDVERANILIAFSTGRHLPSIERFYEESATALRADACVCMVGTEVWNLTETGYVRDAGWSDIISDGWDKRRVEAILDEVPGTVIQPAQWQSEFKSSYFLEESVDARLDQIDEQLRSQGLRAKVVYSAGKFLDLVPYRSGKGGAVAYLAERLGVVPDDVLTAGDTGNDLDMMRPELGFRAVAVGNATAELRTFSSPRLYHAKAPYAAGVREGLVHHGWL